MGKLYDHPYRSWGYVAVHDPDPRVDEPPGPGEGRVINIDLEHTYATASESQWKRCQVCPKTVCYAYPHIRAFVQVDPGGPLGGNCVHAFFCSKECLGKWASRNGGDANDD